MRWLSYSFLVEVRTRIHDGPDPVTVSDGNEAALASLLNQASLQQTEAVRSPSGHGSVSLPVDRISGLISVRSDRVVRDRKPSLNWWCVMAVNRVRLVAGKD